MYRGVVTALEVKIKVARGDSLESVLKAQSFSEEEEDSDDGASPSQDFDASPNTPGRVDVVSASYNPNISDDDIEEFTQEKGGVDQFFDIEAEEEKGLVRKKPSQRKAQAIIPSDVHFHKVGEKNKDTEKEGTEGVLEEHMGNEQEKEQEKQGMAQDKGKEKITEQDTVEGEKQVDKDNEESSEKSNNNTEKVTAERFDDKGKEVLKEATRSPGSQKKGE